MNSIFGKFTMTFDLYTRRKALTRSLGFVGSLALLTACKSEQVAHGSNLGLSQGLTTLDQYQGYSNAYEFGNAKSDPKRHMDKLNIDNWKVEVDGKSYDLDILRDRPFDDLDSMDFDFRCVEAWGMRVNYNGYTLSEIINRFGDPSKKYVSFTCVEQDGLPGQGSFSSFQWPYTEALTMQEAMHPLCWAVFGNYGVQSKANGAPLRINVPWKYGFKSAKFIVKIECTDEKPPATWNRISQSEYGWYSNVYPTIDHPRWSQATHRMITTEGTTRVDTLPYNGYEAEVGHMYKGDIYEYR